MAGISRSTASATLAVLGVDDAQDLFGGQRVDGRRRRVRLFRQQIFEHCVTGAALAGGAAWFLFQPSIDSWKKRSPPPMCYTRETVR